MQLRPREIFTIVRGLEDHEDTNTYYVRAVVRNARTDEIIDTLDLEDRGDGHRFAIEWRVPADPANYGFYIIITTSVYTDAAYTTKSLYQDQFQTYLVAERPNPLLGLGGGSGGEEIDYKKLRKIITEELEKILKGEKGKQSVVTVPPAQPVIVNLEPLELEISNSKTGITNLLSQITVVAKYLNEIKQTISKLPKPKDVNLDELKVWIGSILAKISQDLDIAITKKTGVIIQESSGENNVAIKNVKDEVVQLSGKIDETAKKIGSLDIKSVKDDVEQLGNKIDQIAKAVIKEKPPRNKFNL